MLILDSVVAEFGSALVLDASCARVQAGLLVAGRGPAWVVTGDEAGVGLFRAASSLLDSAELKPHEVGAYILCDGPGSQLGIRTAAMAIRTWQALRPTPAPIFTYRSLQLAAQGLLSTGAVTPFAVVCDARRESWFVVQVAADGNVGTVERRAATELVTLSYPLHQPTGFRSWAKPPVPIADCDYSCGELFAGLAYTPVLERVDDAQPWNPAPMEYKTWSGERHRAPQRPADAR